MIYGTKQSPLKLNPNKASTTKL